MKTQKKARRLGGRTRLGFEAPHTTTSRWNRNNDRLDSGDLHDWETVGRLTETPMPGIARAVIRGNLEFGIIGGRRCYVLTDSTRRLSRSWAMDGMPLGDDPVRGIGDGGDGWAIGLDRAASAMRIVIATDAGDFLAQHARAALEGGRDWAVVSMLGSSETLSRDALRIVGDIPVEIPADAGESLLRQLRDSGCRIIERP